MKVFMGYRSYIEREKRCEKEQSSGSEQTRHKAPSVVLSAYGHRPHREKEDAKNRALRDPVTDKCGLTEDLRVTDTDDKNSKAKCSVVSVDIVYMREKRCGARRFAGFQRQGSDGGVQERRGVEQEQSFGIPAEKRSNGGFRVIDTDDKSEIMFAGYRSYRERRGVSKNRALRDSSRQGSDGGFRVIDTDDKRISKERVD
ncbi:hypothetical protein CEXT_3711 [Caerostris extrusa]|uniref:Uncharacterized protein n=1 Tax=Caerostris extrusa TaxID=172846 RepID=A0AAV4VU36_CAEEX|nr:hypothetical protein CEXT_3711 [Caerostris extrusa]